ncbi:DUF397 domain-containing protein [Streptomyces sp. NPDC005438]|uniref:DUF397 domain-containing protein n=1 Tax=Streptomyces sp. NPDC005438 TaxID=3156880 RepID=UPI0033A70544
MTLPTDTPHWFTSSHSNNGGNCVEVATNLATTHDVVPVRDTKNPHGPTLHLPTTTYRTFLTGVRGGTFTP